MTMESTLTWRKFIVFLKYSLFFEKVKDSAFLSSDPTYVLVESFWWLTFQYQGQCQASSKGELLAQKTKTRLDAVFWLTEWENRERGDGEEREIENSTKWFGYQFGDSDGNIRLILRNL